LSIFKYISRAYETIEQTEHDNLHFVAKWEIGVAGAIKSVKYTRNNSLGSCHCSELILTRQLRRADNINSFTLQSLSILPFSAIKRFSQILTSSFLSFVFKIYNYSFCLLLLPKYIFMIGATLIFFFSFPHSRICHELKVHQLLATNLSKVRSNTSFICNVECF